MPLDIATTDIEFPFRLASELDKFSVAEDLHVRRMDDASKTRLLRIQDATYEESGSISTFTVLSGCLFNETLSPGLDLNHEFCSSNYILDAPSRERAVDFNLALKLAGMSSSSLYIGYQRSGTTHFISPPCYFGTAPLQFTFADIEPFAQLVSSAARRRTEPKLGIMSEMYLYAMSHVPRKESRFIELSVVLEMLLLPTSSTELAYRFALRLAKILASRYNWDMATAFALGKKIYATRSRLVHSGKDNSLDDIAPSAYETARILLSAYMENPGYFDEEALDALCLGGANNRMH